ncbi:hypothetical protein KC992_01840 [Candidatus Saccharibacteria bacterium]|nr:hypothetical protein [Candidatus Saccharibacteria bacterium]
MSGRFHDFGFTPDQGVLELDPALAESAYLGIVDVIETADLRPRVDSEMLSGAGSLSEVIQYFRLPNGQIDADRLYGTLVETGFSSPDNPRFLLLSEDLRTEGTNFIFGFSVKEVGLSVQSLARFRRLPAEALRRTTRHIARHEYGHLLGLDKSSIKNLDTRGGLYEGHCANVCTMQQVMSVPETDALARTLSTKPLAGFCLDCVGSLRTLHN